MDYTIAYVLVTAATVMVLAWILLYFKYKNTFDHIIETIDTKQFMMPELFFIGFGFMSLFKINLRTEKGRRKERELAEVYGEKYAPYHRYCIVGAQITYVLTITPLGLLIGALANDIIYAFLAVVATVAIVAYLDMDVKNSIERRRDEIISDYPEVLSKLTLLVNASLIVSEAWTKVAYTSNGTLYKEMQITSQEMKNGVSEIDALFNFAQRCGIKEIRKFASVLSQNLQKGGPELVNNLKYMNEESWEEKKHRARRKGEAASSKLMIPIMLMFVGILIMVIIPIFINMLG